MTIGECALGTIQAFSFSMDETVGEVYTEYNPRSSGAVGQWPEWMPH